MEKEKINQIISGIIVFGSVILLIFLIGRSVIKETYNPEIHNCLKKVPLGYVTDQNTSHPDLLAECDTFDYNEDKDLYMCSVCKTWEAKK